MTGSKGTTIGGDTKAIYCGRIKHLLMTIHLLRKYELHWGRPKLYWGQGHTIGYLNQPTQLGTKKEAPLGIKHSVEELNQHKRLGVPEGLTAWGTSDASHLRT